MLNFDSYCELMVMVRDMVFNATINNILAISWRSVLLVEETKVPTENHKILTNFTQNDSNSQL
jgi:hypothetical protein